MMHGHGGNIFDAASAIGCAPEEITDMSANINPLGPMPGLLRHLSENIENICRLPEADAGSAAKAYACRLGISESLVIAGAGTTEFIYLLPRALGIGSALVAGPAYADYADALEINGAQYRYFMRKKEDRFKPDVNRLKKEAEGADALFFCNPNNPTGEYTDTEELAALAGSLPETLFVIDESYLPFVPGCAESTLAVKGLSNVVVLRSLSKMHCIPGLRIGFCAAPGHVAEKIRKHLHPWSVNSQALAAVLHIVQNIEKAGEHEEKTRKYTEEQKRVFYEKLSDIPGFSAFPSDTAFMLMHADNFTAGEISGHMLEKRILIRDCSNFTGLDEHFFRISIKDPETNHLAAGLIAEYAGGRKTGDRGRFASRTER